MKHKPPPEGVKDRLIQRSDDTAEKVKTRLQNHHSNVDAVLGYYKDVLVEVRQSQCTLCVDTGAAGFNIGMAEATCTVAVA